VLNKQATSFCFLKKLQANGRRCTARQATRLRRTDPLKSSDKHLNKFFSKKQEYAERIKSFDKKNLNFHDKF